MSVDRGPSADGLTDEDVVSIYKLLLNRLPDPGVSEEAIAEFANISLLVASILQSPEYRELTRKQVGERAYRCLLPPDDWARESRPVKRVLLFGAYGNDNLGDAIQPTYVARALRQLLPDVAIDFYASSWIDLARYPDDGLHSVSPNAILDPWFLKGMDLVVVGGGGLISPAHFPLVDLGWLEFIERLNVPIGLLGIGVAPSANIDSDVGPGFRRLASVSLFNTARNGFGVQQLEEACPGKPALVFPDPVLAAVASRAKAVVPFDPGKDRKPKIAFIVKLPNSSEQTAFNAVAANVERLYPDTIVIAMEPGLDGLIASDFRNLIAVDSEERLRHVLQDADVVFSARYHGCILSIGLGIMTYGVGEEKIQALFADLKSETSYCSASQVAELCLSLHAGNPPPNYQQWDFGTIMRHFESGGRHVAECVREVLRNPTQPREAEYRQRS